MDKPERRVLEDRIQWELRGELHRVDGPAVEYNDGDVSWYLHGQRHREDGPAVIWWSSKRIKWCLNDIHYETPREMPLKLFIAYLKWMKEHLDD